MRLPRNGEVGGQEACSPLLGVMDAAVQRFVAYWNEAAAPGDDSIATLQRALEALRTSPLYMQAVVIQVRDRDAMNRGNVEELNRAVIERFVQPLRPAFEIAATEERLAAVVAIIAINVTALSYLLGEIRNSWLADELAR